MCDVTIFEILYNERYVECTCNVDVRNIWIYNYIDCFDILKFVKINIPSRTFRRDALFQISAYDYVYKFINLQIYKDMNFLKFNSIL